MLLVVKIDGNLSLPFRNHPQPLCKKASQKRNGFSRTDSLITLEQKQKQKN